MIRYTARFAHLVPRVLATTCLPTVSLQTNAQDYVPQARLAGQITSPTVLSPFAIPSTPIIVSPPVTQLPTLGASR